MPMAIAKCISFSGRYTPRAGSIHFEALIDGEVRDCVISGEALADNCGAIGFALEDCAEAFEACQSHIEEIAAKLFMKGLTEPNGGVLVRSDDFAKFG